MMSDISWDIDAFGLAESADQYGIPTDRLTISSVDAQEDEIGKPDWILFSMQIEGEEKTKTTFCIDPVTALSILERAAAQIRRSLIEAKRGGETE